MTRKPAPMTNEQLVERYKLLEKQRDDITAEMEAIKDTVRAENPVGKYETDAGNITVSPNRRFDDGTARQVLTPDEIKACSTLKLDSGLVKKVVAPVRYEACMKTVGDPRVTIS